MVKFLHCEAKDYQTWFVDGLGGGGGRVMSQKQLSMAYWNFVAIQIISVTLYQSWSAGASCGKGVSCKPPHGK